MIALLLAAALARPPAATAGLSQIDGAVEEAIGRGELPGAVVLVGRGDRILFRKAYGSRAVIPVREPMTLSRGPP